MKSKDSESRHHMPEAPSQSWRSSLITSAEIERLVDRLSITLQQQSQTVRELEAAHIELDARQRELLEARAKAERATETLATFLKALGHDLRAPLVSVDAALQMLDLEMRDGDLDAAGARIGEIRRTAAHGLALIDDLFELIRSDAGQWRVEPQAVRISEIIADARAVVTPKAHQKRLTVETRWLGNAADARQFVHTDLVRIRQALVNLLSNAIKFSDRGPIVLEVERGGSNTLLFRVLDSGPGIDPDAIDAIFEPFTQGKRTARHAKDGAGLGLAIVRRCARLLGGDVTAANRDGGGAAFTLVISAPTVEMPASENVVDQVVERVVERVAERVAEKLDMRAPAAAPASAPIPAPTPPSNPAPAPTPATRPSKPAAAPSDGFGELYREPRESRGASSYSAPANPHATAHHQHNHHHGRHTHGAQPNLRPRSGPRAMQVLVVDGSVEAAAQITDQLRKLGLETAVARTLAEARGVISHHRPDLIVADRRLPDGSGLEFHDIAPGTRLVISSANPDPNEFPPGTRILAKPVSERTVQEMVRVSLNRSVAFPT